MQKRKWLGEKTKREILSIMDGEHLDWSTSIANNTSKFFEAPVVRRKRLEVAIKELDVVCDSAEVLAKCGKLSETSDFLIKRFLDGVITGIAAYEKTKVDRKSIPENIETFLKARTEWSDRVIQSSYRRLEKITFTIFV